MLRLIAGTAALVGLVLALQGQAHACAALRATARIGPFACGSCSASGEPLETVITEVSGTALIFNGNASPTLTSLAVELQARPLGTTLYHTVARQVISAGGTDFPPSRIIQTCNGPITSGS